MSKFLFRSAIFIILVKDDKIFLAQRKNTKYMDGFYEIPAGHVDGNEGAMAAVVREGKEELDIDIKKEDLEFVHVMQRRREAFDGILEYFDLYFRVKKWENEPKICEPEKCASIGWFAFDKLPENIVPYNKKAIENILNDKKYSEEGF